MNLKAITSCNYPEPWEGLKLNLYILMSKVLIGRVEGFVLMRNG